MNTTTMTPEALERALAAACAELGVNADGLPSRTYDALIAGWNALQAAPAGAGVPQPGDWFRGIVGVVSGLGEDQLRRIEELAWRGVNQPAAQPQAEQHSEVRITDEKGRPMTYWGGKAAPAEQQGVDENWRREEGIAAVVSQETYNDNGTSDIIKPALPIGTPLYTTPPAQVDPAALWVSVSERLPTEEDYGDHGDVLVRFRYTDTPGRAWTIGESSYLPGDPWNNGWLFGSCDYAEVSHWARKDEVLALIDSQGRSNG
ncbi:hypothetical protein DYQ93_11635 [Xanthomonas sp. LMG 8992]|uniref:DUF551 domain-containing protein n=1 Tax=Xanthomonas sp. LMG 8992 TaxID=1591157 RepID=UPI00136F9728|nr:DUF551 domain-containing protein [Xanthomonas sp. LMG 8992]MXV11672.1 hypothetical protein [Xanthomonas sp. LMG 8992]